MEGERIAAIFTMTSNVFYAVGGIMFVFSIFLFFRFHIVQVVGDLSGRNAKKAIEVLRKDNEKTAVKSLKPSTTNVLRGKLTRTMQMTDSIEGRMGYQVKLLMEEERTVLLRTKEDASEEKTDLLREETTLLNDETEQLDEETILLNSETASLSAETEELVSEFEMIDEEILVHARGLEI